MNLIKHFFINYGKQVIKYFSKERYYWGTLLYLIFKIDQRIINL